MLLSPGAAEKLSEGPSLLIMQQPQVSSRILYTCTDSDPVLLSTVYKTLGGLVTAPARASQSRNLALAFQQTLI
jgi:hypothetical protein